MKSFLTFVLSLLTLASLPHIADACKCAPPPPPKKAMEASDAVFSAKCIEVVVKDRKRICTFEVDRVWKGDVPAKVIVTTAEHGATCGYGFTSGADSTYMIYASAGKEGFTTSLCTRTRTLANAKEDLKELGDGAKPKEEKK